MTRRDEHLYARVAVQARSARKIYAVLDRGCWSERPLFSGDVENNSENFTGKIIDGVNNVASAESKKIGFFHPLFCGYLPKSSIVEVVPNLDKVHHDDDYIAIGQGWQTVAAIPGCLDDPPAGDCDREPCEVFVCANPAYNTSQTADGHIAPLGHEDSTAFYDLLTMTHEMGPNEIPSLWELYGYDGGPPARPKDDPMARQRLLLSWSPNHSAFQFTFQICYRGGTPDRFTGGWPVGPGSPWWDGTPPPPSLCDNFDPCKVVAYYQETFGVDEWCQALLEDEALAPEDQPWWFSCRGLNSIDGLLAWAHACCNGGEA